MKATTTLPRLAAPLSKPQYIPRHPHKTPLPPPTRPFVSSTTFTPTQSLTASRILPYPRSDLYNLIADIPSYPTFLPYCQSAHITSHSSPDPTHNQRWPRTADLRVGWGPYEESFRSRIYCLPHHTLEACAGSAQPTIPSSELPHYSDGEERGKEDDIQDGPLFTSLLTRWKLHEFPFKPSPPDGPPQEGNAEKNTSYPRTEISLVIEARFASAVYSALSQAAAPKVAGMMIEAFEKRAREVLGEGHGVEDGKGKGENRGRKTSTEGVVGNEGLSWNKHH
ncbi:MAG: hypothetical protein Q9216_005705 [Gyalolechia sp. 2 TL-2023]